VARCFGSSWIRGWSWSSRSFPAFLGREFCSDHEGLPVSCAVGERLGVNGRRDGRFRDLRFGCQGFRLVLAPGPGVVRGHLDPWLYGVPARAELLDPSSASARWTGSGILVDLGLITRLARVIASNQFSLRIRRAQGLEVGSTGCCVIPVGSGVDLLTVGSSSTLALPLTMSWPSWNL